MFKGLLILRVKGRSQKPGYLGSNRAFNAYCRESLFLLAAKGGSLASTCKLSTGVVLKAPKQSLRDWF